MAGSGLGQLWLIAGLAVVVCACGSSDAGGGRDLPIGPSAGGGGGPISPSGGPSNPIGGGDPTGEGPGGAMPGPADPGAPVPGGECGMITIEPMLTMVPGNLLVIFDRSMSMATPFVAGNPATRLDEARNAIKTALEPLVCPDTASPDGMNCADQISAALLTFPTHDGVTGNDFINLSCTVDNVDSAEQMNWQGVSQFYKGFDPYWAARPLVLGDPLYPGMHPLQYGTPISFAFERAAQALMDPNVTGNKAVLFLTDGEETPCGMGVVSNTNPVQQAADWFAQGIRTYVVSLAPATGPGQQFNDQVASNGGTDVSITPTDSQTLTDEISRIVMSSVGMTTCEVVIQDAKLLFPDAACQEGHVVVGAEKVPCDQEARTEGFFVENENTIQIVGSWCEKLETTKRLEAMFPCTVLGPT